MVLQDVLNALKDSGWLITGFVLQSIVGRSILLIGSVIHAPHYGIWLRFITTTIELPTTASHISAGNTLLDNQSVT